MRLLNKQTTNHIDCSMVKLCITAACEAYDEKYDKPNPESYPNVDVIENITFFGKPKSDGVIQGFYGIYNDSLYISFRGSDLKDLPLNIVPFHRKIKAIEKNRRREIQKNIPLNVNAIIQQRQDWLDEIYGYRRDEKIKRRTEKEFISLIKKARMHRIYSKYYEKEAKETIDTVIKNNHFDKIVITGHSLGGSMAIICAWDIWYNNEDYENKILCVPFASLRPGNRAFAELLNLNLPNIHRFVYGNDFAPKLLKIWGYVLLHPRLNFRHPGILYHIGPKVKRRVFTRVRHHGHCNYKDTINSFNNEIDAIVIDWDWENLKSLLGLYAS